MARRKNRNDEEVREALRISDGKVKKAAQVLGISRQSLHQRLKYKPYLMPIRAPRSFSEALTKNGKRRRMSEFKSEMRAVVCYQERPRYSDKLIEELVLYLRGDLERYRKFRSLEAGLRPHAISNRHNQITVAVSRTLGIAISDVWPELRGAWGRLQWTKLIEAELARRRRLVGLKRRKPSPEDNSVS